MALPCCRTGWSCSTLSPQASQRPKCATRLCHGPRTWAIRYLVVDTRNWWPGKKVLVAPQWIAEVSWDEATVTVDLARGTIKDAPEYHPDLPISCDFETRLYGYYGQPGYWSAEAARG